mmetsp:Transcript_64518/g.185521  ORF Transcript_64518/g.185521 Transcript_64518/m.185521 type:complete len:269 (-) Transcript_64518:2297-3103(-)
MGADVPREVLALVVHNNLVLHQLRALIFVRVHAAGRHLVLDDFERHHELLLLRRLLIWSHLLNFDLAGEDADVARRVPHLSHVFLPPVVERADQVVSGLELYDGPVVDFGPLHPHAGRLAVLRVTEEGDSVHTSQDAVDLPEGRARSVRPVDGRVLAARAVLPLGRHRVDSLGVVFVSHELELEAQRGHLHLRTVPTLSSRRVRLQLLKLKVGPRPGYEVLAPIHLANLSLQLCPRQFFHLLPPESHTVSVARYAHLIRRHVHSLPAV